MAEYVFVAPCCIHTLLGLRTFLELNMQISPIMARRKLVAMMAEPDE